MNELRSENAANSGAAPSDKPPMNGADCLVGTMLAGGVDVCFSNPGTSEMHFVAALDREPRMRCILALFEGVATGAADGYFRMADRPASTLLHLGPGLGNGLSNLHNAKRARSGILNVVGQHALDHIKHDAPLTSDIEGIARPVSHWVRTSASANQVGQDAADAIAAAQAPPGQIATLILPGDTAWNAATAIGNVPSAPARAAVELAAIKQAAALLRSGEPTLIVLANSALRADATEWVGRIADHTGCRVASQFFSGRLERGAGRVTVERIPYAVDQALAFLQGFRHIITVETGEPVAFFAYPHKPSLLKPDGCDVHNLCPLGSDPVGALEALAQELGATRRARLQHRAEAADPYGLLTPASIAAALSAALPENAIVVDESLTTGRETFPLTAGAAPHDWLQNMGGSIGFGTPVATGAAIACPDRKVVCIVGDGSAMYTLQSLWTQAREGLDVTTVIFANRTYNILKTEFAGVGAGQPGRRAIDMLEIDRPTLDWRSLARGMGVPSTQVTAVEDLTRDLRHAVRESGPRLIEVVL